ncbi:MAG: fructose bisphosphate aldolase [Clostridiales bacterium]|nr:fructose bisphosphate aldolase [Clostridiales bacterium]
MRNQAQYDRMQGGMGFIAALDQSGGSTPKALLQYGIAEDRYSGEAQMFDLIHAMRARIIKSPAFTSARILAAILFEQTMDRAVEWQPTADYLWKQKGIVPILKVDQGLAAASDGVQLMKPIAGLDGLLSRAAARGIFGTKMRAVIKEANRAGIRAVVDQQFAVGRRILDAGLIPMLEPEVDIRSATKPQAEAMLKEEIVGHLADLGQGEAVMLKLSIPTGDNFYADLIKDPRVLRVVALSGGYTQAEANARLAKNHGLIASFSRALLEGLTAGQTDAQFDATLARSVEAIYAASAS